MALRCVAARRAPRYAIRTKTPLVSHHDVAAARCCRARVDRPAGPITLTSCRNRNSTRRCLDSEAQPGRRHAGRRGAQRARLGTERRGSAAAGGSRRRRAGHHQPGERQGGAPRRRHGVPLPDLRRHRRVPRRGPRFGRPARRAAVLAGLLRAGRARPAHRRRPSRDRAVAGALRPPAHRALPELARHRRATGLGRTDPHHGRVGVAYPTPSSRPCTSTTSRRSPPTC